MKDGLTRIGLLIVYPLLPLTGLPQALGIIYKDILIPIKMEMVEIWHYIWTGDKP